MANNDDRIRTLRSLAQSLVNLGRFDQAEHELREALSLAPHSAEVKLALAQVYHQWGKHSQALVILEDLAKDSSSPAEARALYARLLLRSGDVPNAVAQYKLALESDPHVDPELGRELGVNQRRDSLVSEGRVREPWSSEGSSYESELERPKTRFDDVGGMDALKEEISMRIIYPLQHPEIYKAYGKAAGGGILMYGPPGCGKTYLARATAGEIQASFLSIGINDVLEMWIGNSERNLHEIFDQARQNTPCVLFFDEVDALGARRADVHGGMARNVINQFLAEMDGVESSNEGVLILAATNAPWHIDPAFRRPGRFDRVLFVPPPDLSGRAAILRVHCAGKPVEEIDFQQLAKATDNFSGADLKAVIDMAAESKLREAMKTKRLAPIGTKDLLAAAKTLKPTTREWFSTARNYALYSNQGGIYDDVLKYLKL